MPSFSLSSVARRWGPGARSASAFAIPASVLAATGHANAVLFVLFGAFAVLYGDGRAYRVRGWVVLVAGLALMAAIGLGGVIGSARAGLDAGTVAIEIAVLVTIAMIGTYVVNAGRLGPPGPLFFTLTCAGGLVAGGAGVDVRELVSYTAFGVGGSMLVSMAGILIDRRKPERLAVAAASAAVDAYLAARADGPDTAAGRHAAGEIISHAWAVLYDAGISERAPDSPLVTELLDAHRRLNDAGPLDPGEDPRLVPLARPSLRYRLRRSLTPNAHALVTTLRVGFACAVAGVVGWLLWSPHPHWAILTALIVLQLGPDRVRGRIRAEHRMAGTIVGSGLFALIYHLSPSGYPLIAIVAVLLFGIEVFIPSNYALAAVFITPVALLAGLGGATDQAIGALVGDRVLETVVGVVVAVLVLRLLLPHAYRRTFLWTETRVRAAIETLVEHLRTEPVDRTMELRRDLQFELTGAMRGGVDAAHDDAAWTRAHWPGHAALILHGYRLLSACWAVPQGERMADPEHWIEWKRLG